MNKSFRIIYLVISILFFLYLSLPNPKFPLPPYDAIQSDEPADTETTLRRGYFTDLSREEVMEHYMKEFGYTDKLFDSFSVSYRLNYPPEESQTIVRDQTRSTFLEEIVHPLRESIFVNGFEPTEDKDLIRVDGKLWRQKIIVRYYPSNRIARIILGVMVSITGLILIDSFSGNFTEFLKETKKWPKRK